MIDKINNDKGVTAVTVLFHTILFLALATLAIDTGHLLLVKNELQNAADAGALAGARDLYLVDGTSVNPDANQTAYDIAKENMSDKKAVDIDWTSGTNIGDIQRGHWSFSKRKFEPIDSLATVSIGNYTTQELDENEDIYGNKINFVNAVRVYARRDTSILGGTNIASFFAKIIGIDDFKGVAEAIAYLGFAGTLAAGEVDIPIAICKQSIIKTITEDGVSTEKYDCSTGRMLNSGKNAETHNTAAWTNFTQPCENATPGSVQEVLDGCTGNPEKIILGDQTGTTGGTNPNLIQHNTKPDLMECWEAAYYDSDGDGTKDASIDTDDDGVPDMPWNVTLPVIDCPKNNPGTCSKVMGAVNVDIVWIMKNGPKIDKDAPYKMGSWPNTDEEKTAASSADGNERWNSFISHFNLKTADGTPAIFSDKSIYFLPDCKFHEPTGVSGGENFGILAKIPVLVK